MYLAKLSITLFMNIIKICKTNWLTDYGHINILNVADKTNSNNWYITN